MQVRHVSTVHRLPKRRVFDVIDVHLILKTVADRDGCDEPVLTLIRQDTSGYVSRQVTATSLFLPAYVSIRQYTLPYVHRQRVESMLTHVDVR